MKYQVQFEIRVPDQVSEQDVSDWASFMTGYTGALSGDNPLNDVSFDPIFGTFKIEAVDK